MEHLTYLLRIVTLCGTEDAYLYAVAQAMVCQEAYQVLYHLKTRGEISVAMWCESKLVTEGGCGSEAEQGISSD